MATTSFSLSFNGRNASWLDKNGASIKIPGHIAENGMEIEIEPKAIFVFLNRRDHVFGERDGKFHVEIRVVIRFYDKPLLTKKNGFAFVIIVFIGLSPNGHTFKKGKGIIVFVGLWINDPLLRKGDLTNETFYEQVAVLLSGQRHFVLDVIMTGQSPVFGIGRQRQGVQQRIIRPFFSIKMNDVFWIDGIRIRAPVQREA